MKYYVGDVGTEIIVEVGSEIDAATVMQLLIKKPSGVEVTWDCEIGPVDAYGKFTTIMYVVKPGDWDEPGWWIVQSYIEMPGWQGKGDSAKFELKSSFK
jgi:hypothetical protein